MGNCQAVDTATLVIQYPSGRSEKLYWPVIAGEIMKTNPGHYVALLISTTLCPPTNPTVDHRRSENPNLDNDNGDGTAATASNGGAVRLTRIKLLRPTDTLVLGQVYRLITTQEVMKGLWAKKQAKRTSQSEGVRVEIVGREKPRIRGSELEKDNKVNKQERLRSRTPSSSSSSSTASATAKQRTWQPSLRSISEAAS